MTAMTADAPWGPARDDPGAAGLVARARAGDKHAWDALVERYAPLIWSICRRYRLGRADADDVGQSVWLYLVDHLDQIRGAYRSTRASHARLSPPWARAIRSAGPGSSRAGPRPVRVGAWHRRCCGLTNLTGTSMVAAMIAPSRSTRTSWTVPELMSPHLLSIEPAGFAGPPVRS